MQEIRTSAQALWDGSGAASQREYELICEPGDPATFDEYIAKNDPLIPRRARANLIMKVFDNEIVGKHINNMRWGTVSLAASPHKLLTSDRPVGLYNIKKPDGMITLPISPTKLLVAVNDQKLLQNVSRVHPREVVSHVNKELVERARRYVWASDQSQEGFIERYMSTRLEPTPFFPSLGKFDADGRLVIPAAPS